MEENFALQERMGVEVELLTPSALATRFPSVSPDGVDLAVLSEHDAWIDPHAALMGFRRKARSLGARYVTGEVIGLEADSIAVRAAQLRDGTTVTGETFVNACGAWCAALGAMVGLDLPVEPMSRENCYFTCADPLEPLPLIKTETDLAFRPEGAGYTGGVPDWSEPPGWNFDISPTWFEEVVWPALARRIPAMERVRLERSWRGHYARSALDYSPILGRWEGGLRELRARERIFRPRHHARPGHRSGHRGAHRGRRLADDRSLLLLVPADPRGAPVSGEGDRLTWTDPDAGRWIREG